jgi:hypothetical protein
MVVDRQGQGLTVDRKEPLAGALAVDQLPLAVDRQGLTVNRLKTINFQLSTTSPPPFYHSGSGR